MKPMPCNKGALFQEATFLGMLAPNPCLEKPRAKLLKCIHSSMKIQRSFNHVSILSVGTTGVGKSATVNHLLGVELAGTSEMHSGARSIKEHIIYDNDPKYEVEGLSLGLVDTPGFCDTHGSNKDAYNLLLMRDFFNTHPKLSKCYPNLVLLVVKATDNRIKGENSELGKSLRCIKQLGLVDPKNPNVVVILTHVCSIQKKNDEEWTKELNKRKSDIFRVVFNALNVSAPVILIENMYDDCDLEYRGNYTVLPNGEMQPKNLYEACASVLLNNDDGLGLITLNRFFKKSKGIEDCRAIPGHECKANNSNQCTLDSKERAMVENEARGGTLHFF